VSRRGELIKDLVKLALNYHLLNSVKVAALKDLDSIRGDDSWERIRRGEEVDIPLWLALILEPKGYVEIRESKVSDVDVSKYLIIEKSMKGGEFLKLRDTFLIDSLRLLNNLRKSQSEGKASDEVFKLIRVEADFKDLIRMRLRKITQIALLGKEPEEYYNSLLLEERVLLKKLYDIINSWMKVITGYE